MSSDVQVIWQTPKHIFVRRGNVVVQLRGEEHSIEALEAQETGICSHACNCVARSARSW